MIGWIEVMTFVPHAWHLGQFLKSPKEFSVCFVCLVKSKKFDGSQVDLVEILFG